MFDDTKRRRAAKRIRPGDGHALRAFRWWQLLTGRKLFFLHSSPHEQRASEYAVDVYMSGKRAAADGTIPLVHLYRDGRHEAVSRLPAAFPVDGGVIEVAVSERGLTRAHYVTHAGVERQLSPHPRSAIGRRLRFERDHPTASRGIGAVSVLMLIVGVGLNVLQFWEPISEIPPIVETFGPYESPIHLPIWLNVALGLGAGIASTERALRLRYHWLLDGVGT